jgi:thioester reductase-like protein
MDCIGDRGTAIQEFYRGASVLITGGTGFMGKVLIEKLLRSCPHLSNIYLLIRSKKGKDPETRLDDLFNDPVSTPLLHSHPCNLANVKQHQQHSRLLLRMPSYGMLRRVALVRTEVSEERIASIIRVTRIGELGTTLAITSN